MMNDENEELHVHIQGDDEARVEAAAKIVADLLVPVDDDKNEHKQRQMRELVSSYCCCSLFISCSTGSY